MKGRFYEPRKIPMHYDHIGLTIVLLKDKPSRLFYSVSFYYCKLVLSVEELFTIVQHSHPILLVLHLWNLLTQIRQLEFECLVHIPSASQSPASLQQGIFYKHIELYIIIYVSEKSYSSELCNINVIRIWEHQWLV